MEPLVLKHIEEKYKVLDLIKEGGMGAIYTVLHRQLDEIRVVKIIRPGHADDPEIQRRFWREARAAIKLKHTNIVRLIDFHVDDNGAYMVMEYIEGLTLKEILAEKGVRSVDLTLEIGRQALRALAYLHRKGFVHRDLSPDNLMLTRDIENKPLVKLIDLGIVKPLLDDSEGLTMTGQFVGKFRYACPEQFSQEAKLSPQSDLYSFGVMFYELLTGTYPFEAESINKLMAAHLFQDPISFEVSDPEGRIPQEVRQALLEALTKDPKERISSAMELHERISVEVTEDVLSRDFEFTLPKSTASPEGPEAAPNSESGQLGDGGLRTEAEVNEAFMQRKTPVPETTRSARQQQIEGLLTEVSKMTEVQNWHAVRSTLFRVLAVDPDNDEARTLLTSAEASLVANSAQREQDVQEAADRIEGHLKIARVDDASRELADAASNFGEHTALSRLGERITRLREELEKTEQQQQREDAIREAVARVAEELENEAGDEAETMLEAAKAELGDDPRFDELQTLLDGRRLEGAIERSVAAVEELLKKEQAAEAEESLRAALADLGEDPRFAKLGVALSELRAVLDKRHHEEAVQSTVEVVQGHLQKDNAEEAQQALEAAKAELGDDPRFDELDAALVQLTALLEERRHEEAVQETVEVVQGHLQKENAGEAQRALQAAIVELGEDPRFAELEAALLQLTALLDERRHEEAVAYAVRTVEERLLEERAEEAQEALHTAKAELGEDPRFDELAVALSELKETLDKRHHEEAVQETVEVVQGHLQKENAGEAQRALQAAVAKLGEDPRFDELDAALDQLQSVLGQREHETAVTEAVRTVEEHLKGDRFEEAEKTLLEAVERLGEEPSFAELNKWIAPLKKLHEKDLGEEDRPDDDATVVTDSVPTESVPTDSMPTESGPRETAPGSHAPLGPTKLWADSRVRTIAAVLVAIAATSVWLWRSDFFAPQEEVASTSLIEGPDTTLTAEPPDLSVAAKEADAESATVPETVVATEPGIATTPEASPPPARLRDIVSPATSSATATPSPADAAASAVDSDAPNGQNRPSQTAAEPTAAEPTAAEVTAAEATPPTPSPVVPDAQDPGLEFQGLATDATADNEAQPATDPNTELLSDAEKLDDDRLEPNREPPPPAEAIDETVLTPTAGVVGGADQSKEPEPATIAPAEPPQQPIATTPVAERTSPPPAPRIVLPRLISSDLRYPRNAKRRGRRDTVRETVVVVISALIDENGKVVEVRVKSNNASSVPAPFEAEAKRAARQADYEPATRDGSPWKMWLDMRFVFNEE